MTTMMRTEFVTAAPEAFVAARDKLDPALLAYLTPYTAEEYCTKRTRLYLSEDRQSGFGIDPDGNLNSLFSLIRGRGIIAALAAVARGATHLDCLGEHLRTLYECVGFRVTFIGPWSDAAAQPGWDYERFGRPNYYEMRR